MSVKVADLKKLGDLFQIDEIEWRVQSSSKKGQRLWVLVLAYITNRAIMKRLDEVCGPGDWKNEFIPWQNGATLCGLSILVDRGKDKPAEWVTKWDGAENTAKEPVKGGLSSAMKRAAVQWGMGQYLYDLDVGFANCSDKKQGGCINRQGATKNSDQFYWETPRLPQWAIPKGAKEGQKGRVEPSVDDAESEDQSAKTTPFCDKAQKSQSTTGLSQVIINEVQRIIDNLQQCVNSFIAGARDSEAAKFTRIIQKLEALATADGTTEDDIAKATNYAESQIQNIK